MNLKRMAQRSINSRVFHLSRREVRWLVLILLTSLGLRLGNFLIIHSVDPNQTLLPDSFEYENTALALLKTGRFAVSPEQLHLPQTIRTPGYPAFIAAIYLLFGERRIAVIVLQILISVGTIALTYVIGRRLWKSSIAVVAAFLLSIDFSSFVYSQLLLTETVFTFLITLAGWAGVRVIMDARKWRWALLLGGSLALATLVRPISYYLMLPVLLGFLIYGKFSKMHWKGLSIVFLLIVVPWICFVGGWRVRNWLVTGSSKLSHIEGINLLYYRGAGIIAL